MQWSGCVGDTLKHVQPSVIAAATTSAAVTIATTSGTVKVSITAILQCSIRER